jgi:hypothetical protein
MMFDFLNELEKKAAAAHHPALHHFHGGVDFIPGIAGKIGIGRINEQVVEARDLKYFGQELKPFQAIP